MSSNIFMLPLTGSVLIDQILNVVLGSNMFIGGLAACVLDNLVRGKYLCEIYGV